MFPNIAFNTIKCHVILLLFFVTTLYAQDDFRNSPELSRQYSSQHYTHASAFGPLFEYAATDNSSFLALRPFYSRVSLTGNYTISHGDLIWPIGGWRYHANDKMTYFYPFFYKSKSTPQNHRTWWGIFPIFCHEKDCQETTTILFPIAGTARNIGGLDRFQCFLWPLWCRSEKDQLKTQSYLFPCISITKKNNQIIRHRFWPFYGIAHHPTGTKSFYLWPFFHSEKGKLNNDIGFCQDGFFFFPFYGKSILKNRNNQITGNSTTFLWPFFTFEELHYTHLEKHNRTIFWPFYINKDEINHRNNHRVTRRLRFPFYGRSLDYTNENKFLESKFILWPLYIHHLGKSNHVTLNSKRIALFYHTIKDNKTSYSHLWPLIKWQNDTSGYQVRFPALWPSAKKSPPPISRNIEPVITLYQHAKTDTEFHQKILWGLWERHQTPTFSRHKFWPFIQIDQQKENNVLKEKKISFLFNLFSKKWHYNNEPAKSN